MLGQVSFALTYTLFFVFAVYIGKVAWPHRSKPAGKWFLLNIAGMGGWSLAWAGTLLAPPGVVSRVVYSTVFVFLYASVIGITLMAYEYTQKQQVRVRRVLPLCLIPVVTLVVVATNDFHHLMWGESFAISARGVVTFPFGPWFYVHALYSYALLAASLLLLVTEVVRSDGIYRRQATILLLGIAFPVGFNVADTVLTELPYITLTPIGYLVGSALWGYGLFRLSLFEVVPMARRTALAEMDDAVVMVNTQGMVVGANDAAHGLLTFESDPTGQQVRDAFRNHPNVLRYLQSNDDETTVSLTGASELRYLTVNRTEISAGQTSVGHVIVFQDITTQKERENELQLLKSVLTRVLRHNIRNNMTTVQGRAQLLAEGKADREETAETIVAICDDIIDTSEKARTIEQVVSSDRERSRVDLADVVEETVTAIKKAYPNVVVETDLPESGVVLADHAIDLAVENVVENAVEHTEGVPYVRISLTEGDHRTTLTVEDDGPGIHSEILTVLRNKEISALSHSSGIGLWLVQWVVETSGGSVTFENTDRGTRVDITLEVPPQHRPAPTESE